MDDKNPDLEDTGELMTADHPEVKKIIDEFRDTILSHAETPIPISEGVLDTEHVTIELEAMQKMLLHVFEFGNFQDKIKKWKEVYGLLIGKIEDGHLKITNAAPITHGTARGVEFKKEDYVFAARLNDMITQKANEFFVGWYHSHPAIGLFLSGVDLVNHLGYQMVNQVAVAVVFDHTLLIDKIIPFKVYRLDSVECHDPRDLCYHEVEYDVLGLDKDEEILYSREIHDEIAKELKRVKYRSAEKMFRREIEKDFKEYEKSLRKEHLKYDKTDYKALKKGKRAKVAKKKKRNKKTKKKKKKKKKKTKKSKSRKS